MKRILLFTIASILLLSAMIQPGIQTAQAAETSDYRAWRQRDPEWKDIVMGTYYTIGQAGCLVTSVTKLLIQAGIKNSSDFNPGVFTRWLNENNGFYDGSNYLWGPIRTWGFNYVEILKKGNYSAAEMNAQIVEWVSQGYHMAVNVDGGGHWVAVDELKTLQTEEVYIWDSADSDVGPNTDIKLKNRYPTFYLIRGYTGGTTPSPTGSEMSSGYERQIPDGDYIIASAAAGDKARFHYLDIEGSASPAADGSRIITTGPASYDSIPEFDAWHITYLNNGFYKITQKGTNKVLSVKEGSLQSGAGLISDMYSYGRNEQWAISFNGTDGYRIQARHSGFSLDAVTANANGTAVQQSAGAGGGTKSWLFIPYRPAQPVENGRYILLSDVNQGFELDVPGDTGDIAEDTRIQLWNAITAQSRYNSFEVAKLSNGYYSIIHHESGKALEMYGGVSTTSKSLSLHTPNGSSPQQWAIVSNGGGTYTLKVQSSGLTMDLANASATDGALVRQYPWNGSAAESWHFVPAEYRVSYDANGGSGAPGVQTKYYMQDLEMSYSVPTWTGMAFQGWNTNPNSEEVEYIPGQTYGWDHDQTFYAVWDINKPGLNIWCRLNGSASAVGNEVGYFDVDVYTDGAHPYDRSCCRFFTEVIEGSWYRISNVTARPGYVFKGASMGGLNGTIGDSIITVVLDFVTEEEAVERSLTLGDRLNIQPSGWTGVTYSSSRPEIVTVDANGTARALAMGEAEITATADTGARRVTRITTQSNITGLTVSVGGRHGRNAREMTVLNGGESVKAEIHPAFSNDYRPEYEAEFRAGNSTVQFYENGIAYKGDLITVIPRLLQRAGGETKVLYDGAQNGISFNLINTAAKNMITLPGSTEEIEDEVLAGTKAAYVTIPENIIRIGSGVLPAGCTVFIDYSDIPEINGRAFPQGTRIIDRSEGYRSDFADRCEANGWEYYYDGAISEPGVWSAWSDWSETPEDESDSVRVRTKIQYRSAEIGYGIQYGPWSDWSAWSLDAEEIPDASLKEQRTRTVYPYYCFRCPTCGWQSPYWGYDMCAYGHDIPNEVFDINVYEITTPKAECEDIGYGKFRCTYNGGYWYYWDDGTSSLQTAKTEYSYRTRTTYQGTVYGEWSEWGDEEIAATDSLAVESRILYSKQIRIDN